MSRLTRVLAGETPPGVYRWTSHKTRGDVHEAVMRAGLAFAHLDTSAAESRGDVLHLIGIALDFPDYYGRNLDALADCLGDVGGTVLVWDGAAHLVEDQPRSFDAVLDVLRADARGRQEQGSPPLVVLLRDVPPLAGLTDLP